MRQLRGLSGALTQPDRSRRSNHIGFFFVERQGPKELVFSATSGYGSKPFAQRPVSMDMLLAYFRGHLSSYQDIYAGLRPYKSQSNWVVVLLSERMRAKFTGVAFDNPHVHVFKIIEGKIAQS